MTKLKLSDPTEHDLSWSGTIRAAFIVAVLMLGLLFVGLAGYECGKTHSPLAPEVDHVQIHDGTTQ